jgi:hypothetical protein
MKRILIFKDGIIRGDIKRDIIDIFPETEHSFKQRKTFDEYYYDNTEVEIDLDKNIIIPIKGPFTKEQLIDTLAKYWKYDDGVSKTSRKTFKGTFDDFKKEIEGKMQGARF